MTEPRKPTLRGAVAGSLLVGTILLGAAVGFGVGALVGATVPLGLVGLFAGLVAGFVVVHARFRDL
jgi:F0F1-type ATP synthase assembly protein I